MKLRGNRLGTEIGQIVFGPWPLRPALFAVIAALFLQYSDGVTFGSQGAAVGATASQIPINIGYALVIAAPLAAMKWLHRLRFGTDSLTRFGYLLIIAISGTWTGSIRFLSNGGSPMEDPGAMFLFALRAIIFTLVLHTVFGLSDARLRSQIHRADAAAKLVEDQRVAVMQADERSRLHVARFLHDQVQAGLVTLMLQLRLIQAEADKETSQKLSSIIDELERVRSEDVRSASRQLSPDLQNVGLESALKELASGYMPGMEVLIDMNVSQSQWESLAAEAGSARMAAYRIIEQALLNAAIHGQATEVQVALSSANGVQLRITNNGVALPEGQLTRGAGLVVTDAWVGAMRGTWELNSVGELTVLKAHFPETRYKSNDS